MVRVCVEDRLADVRLLNGFPDVPPRKILTSGCTGGISFGKYLDQIEQFRVEDDHTRIAPGRLYELLRALYDQSSLHRQSGGVHTSIFAAPDGGAPKYVAEDIGRHNTLDKLQGMALLDGVSTRGGVILASGRISSEMLFKAAIMGVPIVGSRTSPTNLALAVAERLNITVVGYLRQGSMNVYTHPDRILGGAGKAMKLTLAHGVPPGPNFSRELQGGYVYVLYGEDSFGRDEALITLKERMRSLPAGEHNLTELGPRRAISVLRQAADVVPFLADRRMVVVRGLLGRHHWPRYRRSPTSTRPQNRQRTQRIRRAADAPRVPARSAVDNLARPRRRRPRQRRAPREGDSARSRCRTRIPARDRYRRLDSSRTKLVEVDMDEGAIRELAALGGTDLRRIDAEMRKLADFAAGATVTRDDVRELAVGRDSQIWALLDGLSERRADKALRAMRQLYSQGESPEALLGRDIEPHYRRLMVARELSLATREERARADAGFPRAQPGRP